MLAQEIRDRIIANAKRGNAAQMETAWDLAGMASEAIYRHLKDANGNAFQSLKQWYQAELAGVLTKDKFTNLINTGVTLYPIRETVDKAIAEGRQSYSYFSKAARRVRRNETTLDEIQRCVDASIPLAVDVLKSKWETSPKLKFELHVADEKRLLFSKLTTFAIAHGFSTPEEALVGILRGLNDELPPPYRRFAGDIKAQRFICHVCGKIPNPPATTRHPTKLRTVPVCAEPCLDLLQKKVKR